MPNMLKSVASTIKHKIHATSAANTPNSEPITPAPMETIHAMKATSHAIGWRIIARVRLSEVPASMSVTSVWSIAAMM